MRQVWLFLTNNFATLLFVFFEITALVFLFSRSNYQRARFLNSSSHIQATIGEKRNNITKFFNLVHDNQSLAEENIDLRQQLMVYKKQELPIHDSLIIDSLTDTTRQVRFNLKVANVITNPMNSSATHITIDIGKVDGVQLQDGVLSPLGVVGKVVETSQHYSLVMPLFHPNSKLNIKHIESNYNGNLIWDGRSFQELLVQNIPRNAKLSVNDTISTNQYSKSFPIGSPVAYIKEFNLDAQGNFYQIRVTPVANFSKLDHVYVVQREDIQEIIELESEVK